MLLALHTARGSFVHLPSVFQACGRPVDAVVRGSQLIGRSRWLDRVYYTEGDERAWASKLAERLQTGSYGLLIVGDEFALRAIYAQPMPKALWPLLPLSPDGEAARTVGSKIEFYRWCVKNGLPIPETRVPGSLDEIPAMVASMAAPCLVKADDGMGGYEVFPAGAEAPNQQQGNLNVGRRWLVQRREPGPMGCAVFFAARGKLRAWYAMRSHLSTGAEGFGRMIVGEAWLDARIGSLCERVAFAAGLHGMGGFDFVGDAQGEFRLIDSHLGRCVALNHFAREDGVCFGDAIGRWLNNASPVPMPAIGSGRSFVKFPEVVKHIHAHGGKGLGKILLCRPRMILTPHGDGQILRRQVWSMAYGASRFLADRCRSVRQAP